MVPPDSQRGVHDLSVSEKSSISHTGPEELELPYDVESLLPAQMLSRRGRSLTDVVDQAYRRALPSPEVVLSSSSSDEEQWDDGIMDVLHEWRNDYPEGPLLSRSPQQVKFADHQYPRGPIAALTVPTSISQSMADSPGEAMATRPLAPYENVHGARLTMLPQFQDAWTELAERCERRGIDAAEALQVARGWIPEVCTNPHQRQPVPEPVFPEADAAAMDILVPDLLKNGVVRESAPPPDTDFGDTYDPVLHFQDGIPFPVPRTTYSYSHVVFPVPKAGTAGRPVSGLRKFNKFHMKPKHFKMQGLHSLRRSIRPRDFFVAVDIQAAYPSVTIDERFQKWFMFRWRGRWYHYVGLVFGVEPAPRLFTKLLAPLMAYLRTEGAFIIQFLDDFLVKDQDPAKCASDCDLLMYWLVRLGFVIHKTKNILQPTQIIVWLGLLIDSVLMRIRLPRQRRRDLQSAARKMQRQLTAAETPVSLRQLASLLGKARAASQCIMCIVLWTRYLLRVKHAAMRTGPKTQDVKGVMRPDWNMVIPFSLFDAHAKNELTWIGSALQHWNGKEIIPLMPDLECSMDAAKTIGGGMVIYEAVGASEATGTYECRWQWFREELYLTINPKELGSIQLGFQGVDAQVPHLLFDLRALVNTDSSTGMSYVNKQGGSIKSLSLLAEKLWHWCLPRGMVPFARHIPGVLNLRADTASRFRGDRSEWKLFKDHFDTLQETWGPHTVDLMASRTNAQLPRYFSRWGDPEASGINCLDQDWTKEANLYCMPPFNMLAPLLSKLQESGGVYLTLVAPLWPTQPWFSTLMQLCVELPVLLDNQVPLSLPVLPQRFPVTQPLWRTAVFRLCGAPSALEALNLEQWSAYFDNGVLRR